ncbi:unnamed protein product [Thelazia callipaeda]|uniref:Uncharacterized protein n=1 Tax=Thelazia callipaeda TaxID=103827 RepID=A0A0N5DBY1_THECL|nr:unnamed protein product [Thelazia callipaeda]
MGKQHKKRSQEILVAIQEKKRISTEKPSPDGYYSVEVNLKHVFECDLLKLDLENKYLCSFPDEFFVFWKHVQIAVGKGNNPCHFFQHLKSLRLCGVFDYLAGHLKDADSKKCLLHDRYATDLPEMQTLAVYDSGRFVYWRDEPNTKKPLIVHVKNEEHFPECVIVGNEDPFYIVAYIIGNSLPVRFHNLFSKSWIENYASYISNLRKITKSRKNNTVGSPFHGIGIFVKVNNNIRYRPLNEKKAKLKELIKNAATVSDETLNEWRIKKIMDFVTRVQFANDEKDFGMGLELGHNIFWSNYAYFDKLAQKLLVTAYELLNREVFAYILKVHMPTRRDLPNY